MVDGVVFVRAVLKEVLRGPGVDGLVMVKGVRPELHEMEERRKGDEKDPGLLLQVEERRLGAGGSPGEIGRPAHFRISKIAASPPENTRGKLARRGNAFGPKSRLSSAPTKT